jgi:protein involved in polysaccharide export with SLBB domain
VYIFDLAASRERIVLPIIEELKLQSVRDKPLQVVNVGGRVKVPGQYPLEPGMTVSDLLRAGGGLDEAAYAGQAELTRYVVDGGEARRTQVVELELSRILAGDSSADLPLLPFDYLLIKEMPDWRDQEVITLAGEFRFPGKYPVTRGETLQSVIKRAGGLTGFAYPDGSVFTREELKESEQRQLDVLAERLQRDLAVLSQQQAQSLDAASSAQLVASGQRLLADLKGTQAVGRLVIDLGAVMSAAAGSASDIVVKNGDMLYVPQQTQTVTVIGEVQSQTSHLYDPSATRDDYIEMSGGTTSKADEKRIYVVHANGRVSVKSSSGWFRQGSTEIRPGDTIVVPLDAERMRPLPLWTAVTTVIYNLAVAVAAIGSI